MKCIVINHKWQGLLVCALALMPMVTFGQAIESELVERGDGVVSEAKKARELAEQIISAKGWVEGLNNKADGTDFYIAIGIGDIQAPIDHPSYIESRANAYDKAMMGAWGQIRKFVEQTVSARAGSYYKEAIGAASAPGATPAQEKQAGLLDGLLNSVLKNKGVEPQSATPVQREQALTSDVFTKSVQSVASGPIVGVQTYASAEGRGTGKGYQIAVVAIWSENLQRLAESMFTGTQVESGAAGKPISDWIPTDSDQLMKTFGVQMVRDANGAPVLLAYGQSSPVTESSRSAEAAYAKAYMEATSMLRFFAGAQAKVIDDLQKAETSEEYADGTKAYNSSSTFEQAMDVYAPPAKFSGISRNKSWEATHPLNKKKIVGVIVVWSPEGALVARQVGAKMDAAPTSGSNQNTRRPLEASDKGMSGVGSAASDDF